MEEIILPEEQNQQSIGPYAIVKEISASKEPLPVAGSHNSNVLPRLIPRWRTSGNQRGVLNLPEGSTAWIFPASAFF